MESGPYLAKWWGCYEDCWRGKEEVFKCVGDRRQGWQDSGRDAIWWVLLLYYSWYVGCWWTLAQKYKEHHILVDNRIEDAREPEHQGWSFLWFVVWTLDKMVWALTRVIKRVAFPFNSERRGCHSGRMPWRNCASLTKKFRRIWLWPNSRKLSLKFNARTIHYYTWEGVRCSKVVLQQLLLQLFNWETEELGQCSNRWVQMA